MRTIYHRLQIGHVIFPTINHMAVPVSAINQSNERQFRRPHPHILCDSQSRIPLQILPINNSNLNVHHHFHLFLITLCALFQPFEINVYSWYGNYAKSRFAIEAFLFQLGTRERTSFVASKITSQSPSKGIFNACLGVIIGF